MIEIHNIQDYDIIIVENNGLRETFLDSLGCKVYYTNNNSLPTGNRGHKELQDIFDCIEHYNIQDTEFIVKMTGRYLIKDDSPFFDIIKNIHNTTYDCVVRYGSFANPVMYKVPDCITGLIGMRCCFLKKIEYPPNMDPVEWSWGKATYNINDDKICILNRLGIDICPGSDNYISV